MGWDSGLTLAHVACQEISKLKGASDQDKIDAMRVVLWTASSGDAEVNEFESDHDPLIAKAAQGIDLATRQVRIR